MAACKEFSKWLQEQNETFNRKNYSKNIEIPPMNSQK
jgi:hypothetical protein